MSTPSPTQHPVTLISCPSAARPSPETHLYSLATIYLVLVTAPPSTCVSARARVPYCYYWLFDPREWNRLCHAMHGNGPAAAAPAHARPVNRRCRPSPRDTTVKAPVTSCPDGHSKGARLLGGNGSSKPSIYKYRCYECDNFFTQIATKNLEPTQPNGAAWFSSVLTRSIEAAEERARHDTTQANSCQPALDRRPFRQNNTKFAGSLTFGFHNKRERWFQPG